MSDVGIACNIGCHWLEPYRNNITISVYKGEIANIICPFLKSNKCTSRSKPGDRGECYVYYCSELNTGTTKLVSDEGE